MKKTAIAACLGFAITIAGAAAAQEGRAKVNGVVTGVDQAAGTITLDHDEVPNLKMAPMIMAWAVKDRAMLRGLKAGDKVKFEAAEVDGQPKIVEIEKAKRKGAAIWLERSGSLRILYAAWRVPTSNRYALEGRSCQVKGVAPCCI